MSMVHLRIPNTDEGRNFLHTMRKYVDRNNVEVKVRGRGVNRRAKMASVGKTLNFTHDITLDVADSFAIYFHPRRKKLKSA